MKEYGSLSEAICDLFGESLSVDKLHPVSGGDINDAYALILSDGSKLFMKSNRKENLDFFRKETEGLLAIKRTDTIKTPDILGLGTDKDRSFLLLCFIESKRPSDTFLKRFGEGLALMHQAPVKDYAMSARFGFIHDNYIGAGYQVNDPREKWIDFFRDCRLKPQFLRAERYFDSSEIRKIERFLEKLEIYLIEPDFPSLLHGDLWSGNYMIGNDGEAWLIDPAVYIGHAEADIAMTELFGGFREEFYEAYRETRPMSYGYEERKEIYNLYHLLNHLNLFGSGYYSSVRRILEKYAS